jgi:hypothetical protein
MVTIAPYIISKVLISFPRERENMFSESELPEIQRRSNFYHKKEVARLLIASGIPRNKQAMLKLTALDETDGSDDSIRQAYDCLANVVFAVHPQQINVRDKTTGQIIVSIAR